MSSTPQQDILDAINNLQYTVTYAWASANPEMKYYDKEEAEHHLKELREACMNFLTVTSDAP